MIEGVVEFDAELDTRVLRYPRSLHQVQVRVVDSGCALAVARPIAEDARARQNTDVLGICRIDAGIVVIRVTVVSRAHRHAARINGSAGDTRHSANVIVDQRVIERAVKCAADVIGVRVVEDIVGHAGLEGSHTGDLESAEEVAEHAALLPVVGNLVNVSEARTMRTVKVRDRALVCQTVRGKDAWDCLCRRVRPNGVAENLTTVIEELGEGVSACESEVVGKAPSDFNLTGVIDRAAAVTANGARALKIIKTT